MVQKLFSFKKKIIKIIIDWSRGMEQGEFSSSNNKRKNEKKLSEE
jgi:hypothetical protein